MQYHSFTGTLSAVLLLLVVGVWQLKPFATTTAPNKKATPIDVALNCAVIDPLDRCVQQRFGQADKFFGMSRMRPTTLHINYFVPNTPAESAAVTELEQAGWQVGFYLAGWALRFMPTAALNKSTSTAQRTANYVTQPQRYYCRAADAVRL